jgi:superfamily II DNA/RNA helicase
MSVKKNRGEILSKLGIKELNPMQVAAIEAISTEKEIVLLSPTGSGKTLAFLLPILDQLSPDLDEVQAMILVPTRELAIQITEVAREMGSGYKIDAVYGGRSGSREKQDIKHRPAIIIGTPGRMADHLRRQAFDLRNIRTLVLDEFDKSLEVGFSEDMQEIIHALRWVDKKVLTSATQGVAIPDFAGVHSPQVLDYLSSGVPQLEVKQILSAHQDKRDTLYKTLCGLGDQNGIVFCNFKETIYELADFLDSKGIAYGTFHGDMEQVDRERALVKFRNGTHRILLATDLAARGIDIPELSYILHYETPSKAHEFTHRNGRTARMHASGTAYVILWEKERVKDFVANLPVEDALSGSYLPPSTWTTLYISGGRKDKISKGDIAGLFFKKGNLEKQELGIIEVKNDCAFVAVHSDRVKSLLPLVTNQRLKQKKVRVSVLD